MKNLATLVAGGLSAFWSSIYWQSIKSGKTQKTNLSTPSISKFSFGGMGDHNM
jgi:hypothetical protein